MSTKKKMFVCDDYIFIKKFIRVDNVDPKIITAHCSRESKESVRVTLTDRIRFIVSSFMTEYFIKKSTIPIIPYDDTFIDDEIGELWCSGLEQVLYLEEMKYLLEYCDYDFREYVEVENEEITFNANFVKAIIECTNF